MLGGLFITADFQVNSPSIQETSRLMCLFEERHWSPSANEAGSCLSNRWRFWGAIFAMKNYTRFNKRSWFYMRNILLSLERCLGGASDDFMHCQMSRTDVLRTVFIVSW